MLPFCVLCYLFCCDRGLQPASRCQISTRLFVDGKELAKEIQRNFLFYLNINTSSSLNCLFQDCNKRSYSVDIYYIISDFVQLPANENDGCVFFKFCSKPFQIYCFDL